jgi:hypothetical protein
MQRAVHVSIRHMQRMLRHELTVVPVEAKAYGRTPGRSRLGPSHCPLIVTARPAGRSSALQCLAVTRIVSPENAERGPHRTPQGRILPRGEVAVGGKL